ncbi:MAG TPA: cytochrome c oxidase accessory protein CcoG [Opitutaceae bacterium]
MTAPSHPPKPNLDAVTTIREDGSHLFLHPADVRGRFTLARRISGWFLIALYLSLPWIEVGGYPAVFLDVLGRRFHLFGWTLAFQDAWLLFFLISGLGFALFFVTALLGRVWCGWACPQTVFLEHVYRLIERIIEGDGTRRRALDNAPMSASKLAKRTLKHGLYVLVSLTIAHLFLAYYVSIPELWAMMHSAPAEHWSAFVFVGIFAGALYFNFAWFREQLCIVICPYGRIQSALIDDHSMVIGYDAKRGEPRGKLGTPDAGACVSCNRCVQVCPTGIDIRQGLQIECIGCAACIDACDEVMTKVGRPTGLIRYDSLRGLAGGVTKWVRSRTIIYSVLLAIGATVAIWAFSGVQPANFGITRMQGAAYFVDANSVRNQFLVRLINKRHEPARLVVTAADLPPGAVQVGFMAPVELPAMGEVVSPLVIQVSRDIYSGPFHFRVGVSDEAKTYQLGRQVEFIGPEPELLREQSGRDHRGDYHSKKEKHEREESR